MARFAWGLCWLAGIFWVRELTDRLGADLPDAPRDRMRDIFLTSSRYELSFWEMAWTLEVWPQLSG